MATLKDAIDYARNNPNSDFARQLQERITSGAADQDALKENIDLSWAGRPKLAEIKPLAEEKPRMGTFAETAQDIGQTVGRIRETVAGAQQQARDIYGRVERGETTPLAGTFQTIGGGLGAGARAIGEAGLGLAKIVTPQAVEESVKQKVQDVGRYIAETPAVQTAIQQYDKLTPEQQRNLNALLGVGEAALTVAGLGAGVKAAREGTQVAREALSTAAQSALKRSDEILQTARTSVPKAVGVTTAQVKDLARDFRFAMSDIDPQAETVLKRSNFDEVNRYFQQAANAKADPAKVTPLELAGSKAENAYDLISKARKSAIEGKKRILGQAATRTMPETELAAVKQEGTRRLEEAFGVRVTPDGEIVEAPGRAMKLDNKDIGLITQYFDRLNSLGTNPTVQQVDDFIDFAQGQLYKQSKTLSKLEVASDPVISQLRGITGDLNTRLKQTIGGGYAEVNNRISRLIELQDELSSALGADVRKGGGLMKKLFSPAGGDTRRIFDEILQETGVDLVKEATLAKFAMEGVGDVRQASLLKQLDVAAQAASEIDLTRPFSWIQFIRERMDLDAQELANEIIRRANVTDATNK